jgi:formyl-CoA transferase
MGDTGTGLFAAIGILAALRHRDRKGIGQHVDVAMYDCAVALADIALNYNSLGVGSGLETPSIVAAFKARDGYFVMMCSRRKQFEPLAKIVGHPEWLTDPRFPGPVEWGRHIEDVFRPAIEAWAAQYSKREACDILNGAGIAVGPSHSTGEILVDPHIVARNMVVEMPRVDGVEQPVMMPGNPIKLSKMAEGPDTRVPWLGEHTDEVLGAELGLDAAQLEALRTEGVIA